MSTRLKVGTLFLNNSTGFGVAGGAATGEATTPWAVRDANWTPRAPVPLPIWGGGPPFTPGRRLAYQSYDDVTEPIPLFLDATSHDDAANELQLLRQEVSKGIALVPPLVEIKPDGASNSMYAEIKTGWVQEEGILESPVGGALRMRVTLNVVRGPFFGRLSTGETLLNAVAFTNTFSGGTDNKAAYSTGAGDLIYEGSPLNISFANTSVADLSNYEYYFGTIDSITTDATTQSVTTSSTTGVAAATGDTITVGTVLDAKQATEMRLIAQVSTGSGGSPQMRLKVSLSSVATPFFIGPWLAVGANDMRYDAGVIPSNLLKDTGLTTIHVLLEVKGGGGSVTVTLSNFYIIYQYTMCKISNITTIVATNGILRLRSFVETSGRACLPLRRTECYVLNGSSQTYYGLAVGKPPVYISGASLFFMAITPLVTGGSPPIVAADITATHASLWKTFRGSN